MVLKKEVIIGGYVVLNRETNRFSKRIIKMRNY